MIREAMVLAGVLWLTSCASMRSTAVLRWPNDCEDEGFAPGRESSKTEVFSQPWVLRSVEGVIRDPGLGNYLWIELRPLRRLRPRREVQPDGDGHFRIPGVADGTYCFKVWGPGFRIYVGTIVVSKTADPNARFSFDMDPA
jgi:hypothetical protein